MNVDLVTLAWPIIFGNTKLEHPSGDWPKALKGVWNVAYKTSDTLLDKEMDFSQRNNRLTLSVA